MLDLTPVRDPQLRVTADLVSAPSASPEVRAQAAALWRSINAQPQDVLRDLRRVQALETDVKGLRTLVADNERTLNELRGQLDQARQERSLSLAAIALLALLLAAVVVTWWLRRGEATGAREWWRRRDAAAGAADIDIGIGSPRRPTAPAAPAGRPVPMDLRVDESMFESLKASSRVQQAAAVPVAVAVVAPSPALPAAKAPAQTAVPIPAEPQADKRSGPPSFHSSFQSSQVASMRMVKAEELVDIQQQADFFMSLGQTEQAIEVLASHINHNAETSALVWLDLLAIYRALKRRDDYEALRADFQRVFNAEVPGYDVTPTLSGGLEDYPRALSRIAALWPSPKVMDVIEESIFRKPGVAGSEPFDLEAYRELVMLYNLGREVVEPEAAAVQDGPVSEPVKSGFSETSMQPLSVARKGAAASRHAVDLDTGHPGETNLDDILSQRFGLDSVPEEESPETRMDDYRDPQVPRPSPRLGRLTGDRQPQHRLRAVGAGRRRQRRQARQAVAARHGRRSGAVAGAVACGPGARRHRQQQQGEAGPVQQAHLAAGDQRAATGRPERLARIHGRRVERDRARRQRRRDADQPGLLRRVRRETSERPGRRHQGCEDQVGA
jgi:hypothetical protein